VRLRILFLMPLLALSCCLATPLFATPLDSGEMGKYLQNENRAIVYGEKLIDYGEFTKANQLLAEAVKRFPESDVIIALYGKSLYESGDKDRAEEFFMQALRLNAANILAQQYIEQIREVRNLSESETAQEWASIIKDKIGDLIVFVLSIWLGTSLNSIWHYFMGKWKWHKAKRSYRREDYDDVVRILESHVGEMEQDAIDRSLRFMLSSHQSNAEVREILQRFVIREEDLKVLIRSLDLLAIRKG